MADEKQGVNDGEEPFQTVKRRSKRKLEKVESMEKDDDSSRPSFPPVKVAKSGVNVQFELIFHHVFYCVFAKLS